MISLENPMRQSGARQMAQLMWLCFMLSFSLRVRLKIKAFQSATYPLLFLVTSMEVKPPMIWSSLVQISTKREPLLKMSDGLPQVSCPSMCLLNRRVNFFFWKPSVVRKLASFGKYFLGHPKGSLSNQSRDIYIDSMSSSSSSYSAYISPGAACAADLSFLKLQVVLEGSFMGGLAISFKRWPGRIWLWMVLEVPWSSEAAVMRLELAICLLGSRYILRSRSSSLRISSFLALIYPLRSLHIFSSRFMMLLWSLSMRSFSYSLPCNRATRSFRQSMLAACSTDFARKSFSSAVRQVFSACSSSFFFFSQVFSSYRVNQSLIFLTGSITDSVSFPAESSCELSPLLNKLLSGCNLIMDLYSLVFLLRLASSRKIYLYSCEFRDFLSMSSNLSYWDCCSVNLWSSLKSRMSWSTSKMEMPLPVSPFSLLWVFTMILNSSMGQCSSQSLLYLSCSQPYRSSWASPTQKSSCSLKRCAACSKMNTSQASPRAATSSRIALSSASTSRKRRTGQQSSSSFLLAQTVKPQKHFMILAKQFS